MLSPVRLCLMVLVLLNVAFVQLTDAVNIGWIAPLYGLTILSPWLSRLHASLTYRLAWNAGVVGIFGVLVHHASSAGIRFLLEDGLILAAFCQVHLLNNLGGKQKPDLVFFNSFLIALVTSFFCQDLAYCAVFVGYAWTLLLGLQLYAESHGPAPTAWPQVIRTSGFRASLVLLVTFGAFLVIPRDFRREGLVNDQWIDAQIHSVGFQDAVELGESGRIDRDDSIVFTVTVAEGDPDLLEGYWRGATCAEFDGRIWRPDLAPQMWAGPVRPETVGTPWTMQRRAFRRAHLRKPERVTRAKVDLLDSTGRLLLPPSATRLQLGIPDWLVQIVPYHDGTFACLASAAWHLDRVPIVYELALSNPAPSHATPVDESPFLQLPEAGIPEQGLELAEKLTARVRTENALLEQQSTGAFRRKLAQHMADWLAREFTYILPGEAGAARDLADFFGGARGAHCEYFATALCLMLRSQGVPSRLATGFMTNEWDKERIKLLARSRHAHAWVEVLTNRGWELFDATPAAEPDTSAESDGVWTHLRTRFSALWQRVTGFDEEARSALFAWCAELPTNLWRWARQHPWSAFAAIAALLANARWLLTWRRRRRNRRIPRTVRAFYSALRATKLDLGSGETPRELLRRAQACGTVESKTLAGLESAVLAHERDRYGHS